MRRTIIFLFLDLPWGLPLGFPSLSSFGAFPAFGLPTPNFPSLNSFTSPSSTSTTNPFSPSSLPPSLLSNDTTNPSTLTDLWSSGLSATGATNQIDYNEYAKQLGFLMNAFSDPNTTDKSKNISSPTIKHSKTKQPHNSSSADISNGKKHDDTRRSSSSSRPKTASNPKPSTTNDPTMLDPLTFAAAAAAATGGLSFPYFLPSLLSQQTSSTSGTNTNPSTYPFSSLSSSLTNPTAGLYPFLSPDWFQSAATATTPPTLTNLQDSKQSKKRSKSIRTLTEEHEKNSSSSSLLHSALVGFQ